MQLEKECSKHTAQVHSKMERWQTSLIDRNIHKLVNYTSCDCALLTILSSKGIISGTEGETLGMENSPNADRCRKLYMLLKTRTSGFEVMMEALKTTCQSGAHAILNKHSKQSEGYSKYKSLQFEENHLFRLNPSISVHKGEFATRRALVKIYDSDTYKNQSFAKNELDILAEVDWHPNILRWFVGKEISIGYHQRFAIAVEYKTQLCNFLNECSKPVNMKLKHKMIQEISNGVEFLHRNDIIHLNLKPENIFIDQVSVECLVVKIGEFGFARRLLDDKDTPEVNIGKLYNGGASSFETPEVLTKLTGLQFIVELDNTFIPLNPSIDLFCSGIMFYYIISEGRHAFGDFLLRREPILSGSPLLNWEYLEDSMRNAFVKSFTCLPDDRKQFLNLLVQISGGIAG